VDLTQDYFTLFGLDASYDVDQTHLANRYRTLQSAFHPARFANAPAAEKRQSLQHATFVNEAHAALKDPLARAIYLLRRAGVEIKENATLAPDFLMQQIELREELDDIDDDAIDAVDQLGAFRQRMRAVLAELEDAFRSSVVAGALSDAEQATYKMQFMVRLRDAATAREEKLLDY